MSESSKYEITVVPKATYVADQSDPSKDQYVFAYTITISNTGSIPAQLISRHWIITDANGKVLEVKGPGLAGCALRSVHHTASDGNKAALGRRSRRDARGAPARRVRRAAGLERGHARRRVARVHHRLHGARYPGDNRSRLARALRRSSCN